MHTRNCYGHFPPLLSLSRACAGGGGAVVSCKGLTEKKIIIHKVLFVSRNICITQKVLLYTATQKVLQRTTEILRKAVSYIYLYVCVCIYIVSGRFPEGNHCKRTLYKHTCTTYMYIYHITHYEHACTSKYTTHISYMHTRNIHYVLHTYPHTSYIQYKHTCLYFTYILCHKQYTHVQYIYPINTNIHAYQ
jgi:hypothetical protein